MYPNAVENHNNGLLIGTSHDSGNTQRNGVWRFDSYNRKVARSLVLENLISSGSTNQVKIGCIKTFGNQYFVGFKDGTSTFGIDALSTTTFNSGSYIETQLYEIENKGQKTLIKGVQVLMPPLPGGASLSIAYDIDGTGSYTTLGTIDATNQDSILYGIFKRGNTIQLKITLTSSSLNIPEISKILIY
jgi:hypothetical protein